MERCVSQMDRTRRPKSTSAVSGYWKPPIWTRHSRGRARVPSPAMRRARCASSFSTRLRREQRNNLAATTSKDGPSTGDLKVIKPQLPGRSFFHGTKADLKPGDLMNPGYNSNYGKRKKAAYIYFAGTLNASVWGA